MRNASWADIVMKRPVAAVPGIAILLVAALALAGCPAAEPEPDEPAWLDTDPGGETPQHAVRKLLMGMSEGEDEVVASAIDQTTAEGEAFAEFMRGMAGISGGLKQLQQDVTEKFGEEGLAVVEQQLDMEPQLEPDQIDRMEVEIEGDRAVAHLPDEEMPLEESIELVRRDDDRWYVVPPADMAAAEELRLVTGMVLDAMEQQVRAARLAVEEADSLEQLEELLAAARAPELPFEAPEDFRPFDEEED